MTDLNNRVLGGKEEGIHGTLFFPAQILFKPKTTLKKIAY